LDNAVALVSFIGRYQAKYLVDQQPIILNGFKYASFSFDGIKSLVYYGRGTLGKSKKSVNAVSIVYMPDDSGRKPAFLNVQIMISDRFSYR